MKQLKISLLLVIVISLAACAQLPQASPVPGGGITATPASSPSAPPPSQTPEPGPPGFPEQAAIQAMSAKYGIPVDQIHLIKSQPTTWPDGCLGVVIPGVLCIKGPVEGFRITLEANGKQYEFHTNKDGTSAIDAAQQLTALQFAVLGSDQAASLVTPNIPLGPTYNPAFNGFLPAGGSAAGTAYVLDFSNAPKAIALDANGTRDLSFIQNPSYGLAVWPGGEGLGPRLAWGTQLGSAATPSSLQISNADGSQLETLLTDNIVPSVPTQLVAEFWSMDGQSLYFSREPVGIGGYIPFAGGSNLYRIDIASKAVTELIPQSSPPGPMVCLDAISGDYRFVADHCSQKAITVRDLNNQIPAITIQPPADAAGSNLVGSARFSPDGKRLAFALAKGNPDDEQGWLALSDLSQAGSKLIYTGQAGTYLTVLGWLDNQTLLLESHGLTCNPTCNDQLWTIDVDGTNLTKVADGSFLTVVDNR